MEVIMRKTLKLSLLLFLSIFLTVSPATLTFALESEEINAVESEEEANQKTKETEKTTSSNNSSDAEDSNDAESASNSYDTDKTGVAEDKTQGSSEKVTIFDGTYELCLYVDSKLEPNPEAGIYPYNCENYKTNKNIYLPINGNVIPTVQAGETMILRNVRISLEGGQRVYLRVAQGGKLIIEGEDTYISKTEGCAIIGNQNLTGENIQIKAGTFVARDGNASPICFDNGEILGAKNREDLISKETALELIKQYIPENSSYYDLTYEELQELTEITMFPKTIYKDGPSRFYGFNTWILKVSEKPIEPTPEEPEEPENPTPTPENPEPETPTPEPEEPETPSTSETISTETVLTTPEITIKNPTTSASGLSPYKHLFALSSIVIFTFFVTISRQRTTTITSEKNKHN